MIGQKDMEQKGGLEMKERLKYYQLLLCADECNLSHPRHLGDLNYVENRKSSHSSMQI